MVITIPKRNLLEFAHTGFAVLEKTLMLDEELILIPVKERPENGLEIRNGACWPIGEAENYQQTIDWLNINLSIILEEGRP